MIACKMAETGPESAPVMKTVDISDKAQLKNHEFNRINPTGFFPLIEQGVFRVMGGSHVVFIFLCKSQ